MNSIDLFIEKIHNNHFVEAHEVLENDWKRFKKESKKENAKFLQALINGATSIALWIKKRPEPSLRVWDFFQKNKYLIETINLNEKEKYLFTIKLLEYKFTQKEKL
ncbi:MAG: DUF309 domain-containing protein [Arcobacteraceae bacterium]|jgi:predicted metal-dependent hydrolase|nr:DUF309 domain-containing protein [Arcobacteraceae bacterium]